MACGAQRVSNLAWGQLIASFWVCAGLVTIAAGCDGDLDTATDHADAETQDGSAAWLDGSSRDAEELRTDASRDGAVVDGAVVDGAVVDGAAAQLDAGASDASSVADAGPIPILVCDTQTSSNTPGSRFLLRNRANAGPAQCRFDFGTRGDVPLIGDWDGDGVDTVAIWRLADFHLNNSLSDKAADRIIAFGRATDRPLAGDWNGDGKDTIGVWRDGVFYLRRTLASNSGADSVSYGRATDIPLVGDWDGDGIDTVGIFRDGQILLSNQSQTSNPRAQKNYTFGRAGDWPIVGDWDGDGVDTVAIVRGNQFIINNGFRSEDALPAFRFGRSSDWPLAGDWDRDGRTTIGVHRSEPRTHLAAKENITDHGDATRTGSVAWHLARCQTNEVVELVTKSQYLTERTLVVPRGCTLRGPDANRSATIIAGNGLEGGVLVQVADETTLADLGIDGAHRVKHLVVGSQVKSVRIVNNRLVRTKNNYTSGNPRCHGLVFDSGTDILIRENTIDDIGYPKVNAAAWTGICAGVYAPRGTRLVFRLNTVTDTLTAGLDFTGSVDVRVQDNQLLDNSRARDYIAVQPNGPNADAIVAYHNETGSVDHKFQILDNVIRRSGNHGMHLSGRGILIRGNDVEGAYWNGIHVGDWRSPGQCSQDVIIEQNRVRSTRSPHIQIDTPYVQSTIVVRNNDANVFWDANNGC